MPAQGQIGLFRGLVVDVAVDVHIDVDPDRVGLLLDEVAEEACAAREERYPAHHPHRQTDVGQHCPAHARAVEREGLGEHLGVHSTDRLEQRKMWAEGSVVAGELHQHWRAWVSLLVHGVTETRNELALLSLQAHALECHGIPAVLRRRQLTDANEFTGQEVRTIFGDAEESRATTQESCGERALQ